MAKPEWGSKRTCQSCGTRFYDMLRAPITCPKCQALVETETPIKASRRAAVAAVAEPKLVPVLDDVELDAEAADGLDDGGESDDIDGGDADESGLIEDASDLGEDDDDMAEVMEHLDENLEDEV